MSYISKLYQSSMVLLCFVTLVVPVFSQSFDEARRYETFVKNKEFGKALSELKRIDEKLLTVPQRRLKKQLEIFEEVDKMPVPRGPLVLKDGDVDPEIVKRVKLNLREAKAQILAGQREVAADILIYNQFLYQDHFHSKQLLAKALKKTDDDYEIEDIAKKYFKRSGNYFYGGSYYLAMKDLRVLAIIDKKNPVVFERMGSTYYMIDEKKQAIDAWTNALILDPENKQLEDIIARTKTLMKQEAAAGNTVKLIRPVKRVVLKDPQVMGVFPKQSQAYELKKNLENRGLTVLIEETENGRWSVQVSREELLKQQSK